MKYTERKYIQGNSIPANIQNYLRQITRETYYLWSFIWQKGLDEEIREFIENHADKATPFERIRMNAGCSLEEEIAFFL